jgi:hypothetical protein
MSPNKISKKMVRENPAMPPGDYTAFTAERRNMWAAESCLSQALEALMDLGRHIAAKGFGRGRTEYKEIATELKAGGVLMRNRIFVSEPSQDTGTGWSTFTMRYQRTNFLTSVPVSFRMFPKWQTS